jgi:hypothetical protein
MSGILHFSVKYLAFSKKEVIIDLIMKARLSRRVGYVLREDPFVKSGNLTRGTMKIHQEGGCHHDQWNRKVV